MTYVPCDASFETPDKGGINGPSARGPIRARVKPSRVQLFLSRRILLELRPRPQRCYLCRLTGLGDARLDLIKPPRLAWLWV